MANTLLNRPCSLCGSLGEYVEIEKPKGRSKADAVQPLPEAVTRLHPLNPGLALHYQHRSGQLLKCRVCGRYFWRRTWAPGGRRKGGIRTHIHQSVERMDYLAVYKELETVRFQADQRARGGDEEAEGIARGAQAEQDSLRKNRKREIVTEAAAALQNRHAYSNRLGQVLHQWYSDDGTDPQVSEARLQENQGAECHAEIIRDLLPECPITRTMTSLYYLLAALLADPHPPIRRIIQVTLEKELEFRPHKDRIAVWLHGPGPRGASETPETIWLRETLARIDETR